MMLALCLLVNLQCMSQARAQQITQTFQLSQVSIGNKTVDAITEFEFLLQIRRAPLGQEQIVVDDYDYLLIDLPQFSTTAQWNIDEKPTCIITDSPEPRECIIISKSQAKITFKAIENLVIHGTISNFQNPHSITSVNNIQISLWNRRGELKILATSLQLFSFEASSLNVALSSSSDKIGAKNEELTIEVTPWTRLTSKGFIFFKMPNYYEGAINDFMFATEEPTPCTCETGRVNQCIFDKKEKQLTIKYELYDQKDSFNGAKFQIGQFNNPLIETMTGFEMELLDQNRILIAARTDGITLSGIKEATQFQSYTFNYVDFSNSGIYAIHQFILESSIPVQRNCRIRIVYPEDMTVDDKLVEIKGVGFAQPPAGQQSLPFTIIPGQNTIDIVACQRNFGLITLGTITLSKIKNQDFRHTLEDFKVYMTSEEDLNFEKVYQHVIEDFNVKASQQKAGLISGTIEASSTLVQTTSSLTFDFVTSQRLDSIAFILIYLPEALEFQSKGCTISNAKGFTQQVFCQREGRRALISRIFDQPQDPGKEIAFTLEMFQMPTSVQNLGQIKLVFIDIRENLPREVDVFENDSIESTSGVITKTKEVEVSSDLTSQMGQTYEFSFKMQHSVPLGGFFSILLSQDEKNGVSISNSQDVQANCHRVLPDGSIIGLECITGRTEFVGQPFVNISCSRAAFGDFGTEKEQDVTFKIGGLTNPRIVNEQSKFLIQTLDDEYRYIDISQENEDFQVQMTQLIQITEVEVRKTSETNGAINDYAIRIIPSIKIYPQDKFSIRFPKQIQLPNEVLCDIGQKDVSLLKSIECTEDKLTGRIIFQVLEIDPEHKAGTAIEFVVKDVRNPISTRPTDTFDNMIFADGENGQMAQFAQELIIKTSQISMLNPLKAGIRQSSYAPQDDSVVDITFQTNNPLPAGVAIVIDAPDTLMQVYADTSSCQIQLQNLNEESYSVQSNAKCSIQNMQIVVTKIFDPNSISKFEGNVKISFKTQNPLDSQNVELQKISYQVSIWDSDDLKYGMDKLTNVLFPSISCAYPCKTCLPSNPYHCLTCLPQNTAPQFLHTPIDVANPNQTCVDICPAKQGFTSNGSRNPRRCVKCAETCKECAQNDKPGDVDICTKCQENFPFLWVNKSTCHSLSCPSMSYLSNPYTCTTCGDKCLWCSDRLTCTKCDPMSKNAYLHYNSCIERCPYGYTPVENVCVPCENPCETCKFGDPNTCTSCDNTGDQQFLFGNQCLKECPINTTIVLESRKCIGCLQGCALCDQDQIHICKRCHLGLLLHDNKCVESCPFDFTEAPDRSVCEPRIYLLDENFIPIPFIAGAIFFIGITLLSYWCTGKQSLVASSIIAFMGPIEMAMAAYQVYYSIQDDKLFIPIIIGSAGAFISGILVNIAFIVNFTKQVKSQDRQFERWRKKKWCISNIFICLSCVTSLTIYRLSFSRLYSLEILDIRLNRPQVFLRSILVFTWIKFLIFNIPLICVDIYGINALTWGNQCHMTMMESITVSIISSIFMLWETIKRNTLIESDLDQKRKMIEQEDDKVDEFYAFGKVVPGELPGKAKKKSRKRQAVSLNQIMFQLQNHVTQDELKDAELRPRPTPRTLQKRIRQMTGVLDHIRKQRDLNLNDNLDQLLELETEQAKTQLRRTKSMEDFKTTVPENLDDDVSEVDSVYSYPAFGINAEEKINLFSEFQQELLDIKKAENNKENQWEDPEEMNIYASARDPPPDIEYEDQGVQTMQEKKGKRGSDSQNAERMAQQRKDMINRANLLKKQRDEEYRKQRKKQIKRRGKKFYLVNPLEPEGDLESEESDHAAKAEVPLQFDKPKSDMVHMAMGVERDQSLTLFYDLQLQEGDEKMKELEMQEMMEKQQQKQKGIELSRISGDLDFSDDEDFNQKLLEKDEEAKKLYDKSKIDNIEAWLNEKNNMINLRTFNENDIIGNFERDWAGKIIDEQNTLEYMQFKDLNGLPVNKKGYLINQETGDIVSKYSYEVIFENEELISLEKSDYKYELPLPYKMERFNFNPHQCFGHFEYDDDDKPMILQDQYGHQMDRFWRPVNASGWLIDENGNIIDNRGHIKLVYSQLLAKGQMPVLLNYEGKEYSIRNIMGIFEKDIQTKEIILGDFDRLDQKPKKGGQQNYFTQNSKGHRQVPQLKIKSQDLRGRRVNSKGYLLDDLGNIIDKEGNIIWRSHELLYNEPPKIFNFTEFSLNWIKGSLDPRGPQESKRAQEYDLDGRKINNLGYLVNPQGDIIDRWNNKILFRKVTLEEFNGQESQVPQVFRSGQLKYPDDEIDRELQMKMDSKMSFGFKQSYNNYFSD